MTSSAAQAAEISETVPRHMQSVTNCLSMDVEGFVEANLDSLYVDRQYLDGARETYEIEKNVDAFLGLMDEFKIHATCFFLGRIARDIPHVVKQAARAGQEIGCHSYEHRRIFGVPKSDFREKLLAAKKCLEDVSGEPVYGFRAPDFSIVHRSLWALDVVREAGFVYDSSIYPIRMHDVYGVRNAQRFIHVLPNGLIEWPLSTVKLFGMRFPFGGGGYHRLYPTFVTRLCISRINKQGQPCMFYIHPYEVGPIIPKLPNLSYGRRFRHYYGCGAGTERLRRILRAFNFAPAMQILTHMGYKELANHV
jgi:polysaccharide deacetylase family protein (PEP-CTERM system associated)